MSALRAMRAPRGSLDRVRYLLSAADCAEDECPMCCEPGALGITVRADGKVRLTCSTGCAPRAIAATLLDLAECLDVRADMLLGASDLADLDDEGGAA